MKSALLAGMLADASARRILCLHGRGGNAKAFIAHGMAPLLARASAWEFEAIDACGPNGAWWTYPAGQRSYSAESYSGADDSIAAVEATLATGKYCGLLGFSQGAMLAAVVAARLALGEGDKNAAAHLNFAVICSAALPSPYRPLLERLRSAGGAPSLPTLHCLSAMDPMNPPELGEELAGCFGDSAQVLWHDAGHDMPPRDRLDELDQWLLDHQGSGMTGPDA